MLRHDMVETVGKQFLTSNIEAGEYSYVQATGGKFQFIGHRSVENMRIFNMRRCA